MNQLWFKVLRDPIQSIILIFTVDKKPVHRSAYVSTVSKTMQYGIIRDSGDSLFAHPMQGEKWPLDPYPRALDWMVLQNLFWLVVETPMGTHCITKYQEVIIFSW